MAGIKRFETDFKVAQNQNGGAIYHFTKEYTEENTTEYIFPNEKIYAISAYLSVVGDSNNDIDILVTNDPPSVITEGDAVYVPWNKTSEFNLALTGFKVVWNVGTVLFKITIKTENK